MREESLWAREEFPLDEKGGQDAQREILIRPKKIPPSLRENPLSVRVSACQCVPVPVRVSVPVPVLVPVPGRASASASTADHMY